MLVLDSLRCRMNFETSTYSLTHEKMTGKDQLTIRTMNILTDNRVLKCQCVEWAFTYQVFSIHARLLIPTKIASQDLIATAHWSYVIHPSLVHRGCNRTRSRHPSYIMRWYGLGQGNSDEIWLFQHAHAHGWLTWFPSHSKNIGLSNCGWDKEISLERLFLDPETRDHV